MRLSFLRAAILLTIIGQPSVMRAQLLAGGGGAGFYSSSKLEPRDTSSLEVQVRAPNGSTLDTLAVVSLTNLAGQLITSKTTFGARAVFTPLNRGQYVVTVEAAGYDRVQASAMITADHGQQLLIVTLKSAGGVQYTAPSGLVLAPKAQKEAAKGSEALQSGRLEDALKHLESAHRLAPNHPDISYLLGVVYEKRKDAVSAQKYWEQALLAQPKHLSSLLACGELKFRENDLVGAKTYFQRAVEAGPNSWQAHTWYATVLLKLGSNADAVTHAERAMELGKGEASASLLILGQALAAEHQNRAAVAALKDYLASKPANARAVEELVAKLEKTTESAPEANIGGVTLGYERATIANDLPELPLSPTALQWIPTNVDNAVVPTEPGISCSLPDVLAKASAQIAGLPAVVDRYTATEMLRDEEMNAAGYPDHVENLSFSYLASIRQIENKFGHFLDVQEYRNGSTGNEMFPDKMGSTGLPSVVLIFHPWLVGDFDMKCEGLSRASTGFAWQVYFRQKENKESRIRQYRVGGWVYPIALKGRAWIDANTFQIVRLETDLREPRPDIRLSAEHLTMVYEPVRFKSRNEILWLPLSADYYAAFRGHRIHRKHTFTEYTLFSVDDQQRISEPPKEKASAETATGNKVSN